AAGMPTTMHSDAPLAPPSPLTAASVHMTRATRQGGVSTPSEKLTPQQALRAVTLDAAWSLGLEDEIGSLEVGKRADFTVLDQNPFDRPAQDWDDIPVWGVVLDGHIHPIEE
ncbi:MAG TPA: amidohydrolase, partial [Hellea balneolensis]|nr:amidohydrolase [Hellea balneolensis]